MGKGEDTDNHHFVPQFYLSQWCGEDDKLQEYGRVPPTMEIRSRRRGPRSTGFVPNLYTLPGVTEETKQNVEKVFYQKVDTEASKVRDKLLAGAELTDVDLYDGRGSCSRWASVIPRKWRSSRRGYGRIL